MRTRILPKIVVAGQVPVDVPCEVEVHPFSSDADVS
jgi:hypothetical protein